MNVKRCWSLMELLILAACLVSVGRLKVSVSAPSRRGRPT
jgi:hypothetical protein